MTSHGLLLRPTSIIRLDSWLSWFALPLSSTIPTNAPCERTSSFILRTCQRYNSGKWGTLSLRSNNIFETHQSSQFKYKKYEGQSDLLGSTLLGNHEMKKRWFGFHSIAETIWTFCASSSRYEGREKVILTADIPPLVERAKIISGWRIKKRRSISTNPSKQCMVTPYGTYRKYTFRHRYLRRILESSNPPILQSWNIMLSLS